MPNTFQIPQCLGRTLADPVLHAWLLDHPLATSEDDGFSTIFDDAEAIHLSASIIGLHKPSTQSSTPTTTSKSPQAPASAVSASPTRDASRPVAASEPDADPIPKLKPLHTSFKRHITLRPRFQYSNFLVLGDVLAISTDPTEGYVCDNIADIWTHFAAMADTSLPEPDDLASAPATASSSSIPAPPLGERLLSGRVVLGTESCFAGKFVWDEERGVGTKVFENKKGNLMVWITELKESGQKRDHSFFEYSNKLEYSKLEVSKVINALRVEEELRCTECFSERRTCKCPKKTSIGLTTFEVFKNYEYHGILGVFSGICQIFVDDVCLDFESESMIVHPTSLDITKSLSVIGLLGERALTRSPLNKRSRSREKEAENFENRRDVVPFTATEEPKELSSLTSVERNRKMAALSNMRRKILSYMNGRELRLYQQAVDNAESRLETLQEKGTSLKAELKSILENVPKGNQPNEG